MKIAITGAKGIVGRALISQLDQDKFQVNSLDLPNIDTSNLDDFIRSTFEHDAVVHLAWNTEVDNYNKDEIDTTNMYMAFNCYRAAVTNKIPRVIMASSNHALKYDLRDADGKIRASIEPAIPDSPYGAEKIFVEALGRYYAAIYGLEVICIRIGNVNDENKPLPSSPEDPLRWLSHRDLGALITCCLNAKSVPNNFQVIYGVSKQPTFDWSNPFGYIPRDGE